MKTKFVFYLMILFTSLLFLFPDFISAQTENNGDKPKFDFTSIDRFWEIASILEKDVEPTPAQWESLFLTPGYKELTNREFPVDWIKSYMRKGIMPSKKGELKTWIEKKYSDTLYPLHYMAVLSKKENLSKFLTTLKTSDYMDKAMKIALEYFPKGTVFNSYPPVSFIFFDRDARGYNPILIDLLFAYGLPSPDDIILLLAHEAHHYFRDQSVTFNQPTDASIIWIINQIHIEGMADQIDKDLGFAKYPNSKNNIRYQDLLKKTPGQIKKMDSLLVLYGDSKPRNQKIAQSIASAAPNSGHPMGYFMAKTIIQYLSKEALTADIGNPFAFFYRYQEAALKSESSKPVFSDKAIALIRDLERRYSK